MFRLLLHSLMRGDTREPRAIIEANSWYLIRDPESIKARHTSDADPWHFDVDPDPRIQASD